MITLESAQQGSLMHFVGFNYLLSTRRSQIKRTRTCRGLTSELYVWLSNYIKNAVISRHEPGRRVQ